MKLNRIKQAFDLYFKPSEMPTTDTTREEKINKIYEIIADKTLSFGCIVEKWKSPYKDLNRRRIGATASWETYEYDGEYGDNKHTGNIDILCPYFTGGGSIQRKACSTDIEKIKGHPVMIGDVLDWIEKTMGKQIHWRDDGSPYKAFIANEKLVKLFDLRKDKRNPIEDQSDEAVDFIYSLISQGQTQTN